MTEEAAEGDRLGQADGAAKTGTFLCDDPALLEVASSPWDLMITPIAGTGFTHWKRYLVTPSIVLYREWYPSPTHFRGLSLPLRTGDHSVYSERAPAQRRSARVAAEWRRRDVRRRSGRLDPAGPARPVADHAVAAPPRTDRRRRTRPACDLLPNRGQGPRRLADRDIGTDRARSRSDE